MSTFLLRLALAAALATFPASAQEQEGPRGITAPMALPPFDANAPSCMAPPDLKPVLAFAQDNRREFMEGVARGLQAAAKDRGLTFRLARADNDNARMIEQVEQLRHEKIGAIVAAPIHAESLAPHLRALIASGSFVGTVVAPPAVTLLNAPQYLSGKALGDAAAMYIRTKLGGEANVVLLTHDSLQFLAPRFAAMRDALGPLPGVVIVADISPVTVDKAGGRAMMETILIANPQIDVVLGADTVVLGALEALRAAGKDRPDQFLGGIDGEPEAIAEIGKGDSPYKMTVGLNSPVFAYALGQHAADWLEGKSVPQAMDILPTAITRDSIAQYQNDLADPGRAWADPARRAAYLKMYGNICYGTRSRFVDFPWSSELDEASAPAGVAQGK